MRINPVTAIDFYKSGHIYQYPQKTELVYSNFTCRSDGHFHGAPGYDHKVVWFGMQGVCRWLLQELWGTNFFERPLSFVEDDYEQRMNKALGPGVVGTAHIAALWHMSRLPIEIRALPEGSRVDLRVPLFTIHNTLPEFFWLTNYLETQLSAVLWKSITTATIAYEYRKLLEMYARLTGAPEAFIDWQGHDFSMRGQAGIHDAAQSGAGHLLSFFGTDTVSSIDYIEEYYQGEGTFIGGSVPATEHSVMCMGGNEGELETFRRLLKQYPSGIVSIVSDTWDFWKVLGEYAVTLKDEILNRQPDGLGNAKVVFRPDSGDPVKIICGDPDATGPAQAGAVELLYSIFGGAKNANGFIELNPRVGLIYGDSITIEIAEAILKGLLVKGFASSNIVFGIGSFTYQHVTRDTFGCAIKATYGRINGQGVELYKDPKTDNGIKKSARGLLRVERENGNFVLYDRQPEDILTNPRGELVPVFKNGILLRDESFATIRNRLRSGG